MTRWSRKPHSLPFQSTCPARGTTRILLDIAILRKISIHVPREGHDRTLGVHAATASYFNPRAPRGARPQRAVRTDEADVNFNPRAPRGARLGFTRSNSRSPIFQSTCPARGTTSDSLSSVPTDCDFNPRAPRGARHQARLDDSKRSRFQSTCPARGTTRLRARYRRSHRISIHVPREGHDKSAVKCYNFNIISIHVPREGHDSTRLYSL